MVESQEAKDPRARGDVAEKSLILRAGFGLAGLVVAASMLIAGYCGIRWAFIKVPATTEEHVATIRKELTTRTAAELVREYEDMEDRGIDLGLPFQYKEIANRRSKWGKDASIAASVGLVALLAAIGLALSGRRKTT